MKEMTRNDIKFFKTQNELRKWLTKNHHKKSEIWIGFCKKDSGKKGITPPEALDEALCFGWIDGIRKSVDEISYCNRYTPRTKSSKWSRINTEKVEKLIEAGLMLEPGLKVIDEAKADGRWDRAYASPKNAKAPEDFLKELRKNKKASANFKNISKSDLFIICYKLQNSKKQETRDKWIQKIIKQLEIDKSLKV